MNTHDDLPFDERLSAAFDDDAPFTARDAEEQRRADATFAEWRAIGDELRSSTPPGDVLASIRSEVLDRLARESPLATVPVSRRRPVRWTRGIVAAAAVLAVLVGARALLDRGDDSAEDASRAATADLANAAEGGASAATAEAAPAPGAFGSASSGAAAATGATGAATAKAAPPRTLGAQATLADLGRAFRSPAAGSTPATAPSADVASCGTVLATATLAGTPVQIVDASPAPLVVDARTCSVLGPLP